MNFFNPSFSLSLFVLSPPSLSFPLSSPVSSFANMSAEGQEIRDERVEEPTVTATTQEEGGDDEVRSVANGIYAITPFRPSKMS